MIKNFFNPRLRKAIKPKRNKKQTLFYNPSKKRSLIFGIGTGALFLGLLYIVYLWLPLGRAIVRYYLGTNDRLSHRKDQSVLTPTGKPRPTIPQPLPSVPDNSFSIIIPKLEAKSKVLANINPADPEVYQAALKQGVAHAAGSGFPGEGKSIYLFAHSTNAEWNVVRYNAVFFLLGKLTEGDEIKIVYNNKLYEYKVFDKKVVNSNETKYLSSYQPGREELILQTCWPPGTILKRLLVFAKLK